MDTSGHGDDQTISQKLTKLALPYLTLDHSIQNQSLHQTDQT